MTTRPIRLGYAILLIACAAFFDILSFAPGAAEVTAVVGQLVMAGLFYLAGVNVFQARPAALYAISTVVELIPAVSALPMFLIETIAIIVMSRRGEKRLG